LNVGYPVSAIAVQRTAWSDETSVPYGTAAGVITNKATQALDEVMAMDSNVSPTRSGDAWGMYGKLVHVLSGGRP
jgi:hypothetical protein